MSLWKELVENQKQIIALQGQIITGTRKLQEAVDQLGCVTLKVVDASDKLYKAFKENQKHD